MSNEKKKKVEINGEELTLKDSSWVDKEGNEFVSDEEYIEYLRELLEKKESEEKKEDSTK